MFLAYTFSLSLSKLACIGIKHFEGKKLMKFINHIRQHNHKNILYAYNSEFKYHNITDKRMRIRQIYILQNHKVEYLDKTQIIDNIITYQNYINYIDNSYIDDIIKIIQHNYAQLGKSISLNYNDHNPKMSKLEIEMMDTYEYIEIPIYQFIVYVANNSKGTSYFNNMVKYEKEPAKKIILDFNKAMPFDIGNINLELL